LTDYFDVRYLAFPNENTTEQGFGTILQSLHDTNILMGMHGAGLANTLYLRNDVPGNLLIEFIHTTNSYKHLMFNICSKHNLPYYALDLRRYVVCRCQVPLPEEDIRNLTQSVIDSYEYESRQFNDLKTDGKCAFPIHAMPRGLLSPSSASRCYLEKRRGKWKTCASYGCSVYGHVE
jgi:hypothetical protein